MRKKPSRLPFFLSEAVMHIIDTPAATADPNVRSMTRLEAAVGRAKGWLLRLRRRLPYLVWYGDEIDVRVTFSQDKLDDVTNPFRQLFSGELFELEKRLGNIGIGFDRGVGFDGRDWEWDWSLKGPISVTFRGRASKPWLRRDPPQLFIVTQAKPPAA